VAAVEKALATIEAFNAAAPQLTLSDAAKKCGITRAAARRYLLTLAALGYASYDGKYFRLTPRVLRLGYSYLSASPLPRLTQPTLDTVGEKTQEAASLAVLDNTEVIFIARSPTHRIMSAVVGVGSRLPAYCSSTGRVLLAGRPEAEMQRILAMSQLKRYTPKTKTGTAQLVGEINKVREQQYSLVDEEIEIGLRTISVPVKNVMGEIQLAMSVSVQSARMTPKRMVEQILPVMRTAGSVLASVL
jgi:IclR family pca regulon transcriptional regulator